MERDFYRILGVRPEADLGVIKDAYRREVKNCHPDRSTAPDAAKRFREVREAYETLGDPSKRKTYDDEWKAGKRRIPVRRGSRTRDWGLHRNRETVRYGPGIRGDSRHRPGDPLRFEAVLSPREARSGGRYPLHLALKGPCPWCGDSSASWDAFFCPSCGGSGTVSRRIGCVLEIPAGVRDGTVLRQSLPEMPGAFLQIVVRISGS